MSTVNTINKIYKNVFARVVFHYDVHRNYDPTYNKIRDVFEMENMRELNVRLASFERFFRNYCSKLVKSIPSAASELVSYKDSTIRSVAALLSPDLDSKALISRASRLVANSAEKQRFSKLYRKIIKKFISASEYMLYDLDSRIDLEGVTKQNHEFLQAAKNVMKQARHDWYDSVLKKKGSNETIPVTVKWDNFSELNKDTIRSILIIYKNIFSCVANYCKNNYSYGNISDQNRNFTQTIESTEQYISDLNYKKVNKMFCLARGARATVLYNEFILKFVKIYSIICEYMNHGNIDLEEITQHNDEFLRCANRIARKISKDWFAFGEKDYKSTLNDIYKNKIKSTLKIILTFTAVYGLMYSFFCIYVILFFKYYHLIFNVSRATLAWIEVLYDFLTIVIFRRIERIYIDRIKTQIKNTYPIIDTTDQIASFVNIIGSFIVLIVLHYF